MPEFEALRSRGVANNDSAKPAFFGRRKGHKLRRHQASLIETLLPRLAFDNASDPVAAFSFVPDALRLEIGFGGGEHLVAEAMAHPQTAFIGCEPYVNGMAKILAPIEARALGNIRLYAGDAAVLLAALPDAALSRIDLIHPDPWPKRRHWKRRFVQDATIAAMARVLQPRGEFRFVSDIADYAGWTLQQFARSDGFIWTAERADDWRSPWPGFTRTRYGAKAEREGRGATHLVFRRT